MFDRFRKVYDPVCGREVKLNKATGRIHYQGETFYFCSKRCKDKFEKEVEKLINRKF
ncbi:MAG: YHS domain-containing protein [bacterium]